MHRSNYPSRPRLHHLITGAVLTSTLLAGSALAAAAPTHDDAKTFTFTTDDGKTITIVVVVDGGDITAKAGVHPMTITLDDQTGDAKGNVKKWVHALPGGKGEWKAIIADGDGSAAWVQDFHADDDHKIIKRRIKKGADGEEMIFSGKDGNVFEMHFGDDLHFGGGDDDKRIIRLKELGDGEHMIKLHEHLQKLGDDQEIIHLKQLGDGEHMIKLHKHLQKLGDDEHMLRLHEHLEDLGGHIGRIHIVPHDEHFKFDMNELMGDVQIEIDGAIHDAFAEMDFGDFEFEFDTEVVEAIEEAMQDVEIELHDGNWTAEAPKAIKQRIKAPERIRLKEAPSAAKAPKAAKVRQKQSVEKRLADINKRLDRLEAMIRELIERDHE